ncbi:MAG: hypothetical protein Q7R64_02915 [bacterium]|nr:hypothetical protein [bacterium]
MKLLLLIPLTGVLVMLAALPIVVMFALVFFAYVVFFAVSWLLYGLFIAGRELLRKMSRSAVLRLSRSG